MFVVHLIEKSLSSEQHEPYENYWRHSFPVSMSQYVYDKCREKHNQYE